jgi:hypothetical protein
MAVLVRHTPVGLTADQYEEGIRRLADAGLGHPPARLYHVCFGEPGNLMVSDVWESREAFDSFSETLMPILEDVGIVTGGIAFLEVHNSIPG